MKRIIRIVLAMAVPASAQVTLNQTPTREFGQSLLLPNGQINSTAPNLVDARGLNGPTGIAFDYSVNPPRVWISDTGNNRILGWNNANSLAKGNPADIVLGQHDFYSTLAGGPDSGGRPTTGLATPAGIAVDSHGSVYVADSGNNRILRFPNSAQQPLTSGAVPDLVIGQTSFGSGRQANQGGVVSAKTLSLTPTQTCCYVQLAFDQQGNLWVTDPGNNRVLRYPGSSLTSGMAADTVLGQVDFASNQNPQPVNNDYLLSQTLYMPVGIALDATGRIYVADGLARVVEYQPNPNSGQQFDRILGHPPTSQQLPAYPSNYTVGLVILGSPQAGAKGLFTLGDNLFVCDPVDNRVVWYDVYGNWGAATTTLPSPVQQGVLGQTSFSTRSANLGLPVPGPTSLAGAFAGAANTSNNEIWIVDTNNNRVLAFPANGGTLNSQTYTAPATRLVGQLEFPYNSPNLIEGKEVWFPANPGSGIVGGGAIAVDSVSSPGNMYLYIADTDNHRVLGFKNGRSVGTDTRNLLNQAADLVIGQPNAYFGLANYSGDVNTSGPNAPPSAVGLYYPMGLAVDSHGNLYVADAGNSRVVRFPAPFAQDPTKQPTADLVLGQSSLTSPPITDADQSHMSSPYGLAVFLDGKLAVSDALHNRILIFAPNGADFTSGQMASAVVGQSDFLTTTAGSSTSSLSSPRHIAADSSDRLYVADSNNGRMLVFPNSIKFTNGQSAVLQVTGLYQPQGIAVSQNTGESWVSSSTSQIIVRYPEFKTLQSTLQPDFSISSPLPLSLALDPADDLIVAEQINRVSFYFPKMYYKNAASYAAGVGSTGSTAQMAPGMLVNLGRFRSKFNVSDTAELSPPWPKMLNDIQVTVNGVAAPIYYLLPSIGWIYMQVPMSAPSSGTADFVVSQVSTGQILAATTFPMQAASPGLFTTNQGGTGQIAANNLDGTTGAYLGNNSPTTCTTCSPQTGPISVSNGIVTLYLTGQGYIPNAPPDGEAPNGVYQTPTTPNVYIGGLQATVLFSGLSPQFPGVWQINARVPPNAFPNSKLPIYVQLGDFTSTIGGTNSTVAGAAIGEPGNDVPLTVPNGNITTMAGK